MFTQRWLASLGLITALCLPGCGGESKFMGGNGKREADAKPPVEDYHVITDEFVMMERGENNSPVDVVFLLDTSGSMNDEAKYLGDSMVGFLKEFQTLDVTNHQVYIVNDGADLPLPGVEADLVTQVDQLIFSEDALSHYLNFLERGTFRPDVKKEVIVISDDNFTGEDEDNEIVIPGVTTAETFLSKLAEIGGPKAIETTTISGILGLSETGNPTGCKVDDVGTEYFKLAGVSVSADKTITEIAGTTLMPNRGLIMDLCEKEWKNLLTKLASHIVKKNRIYTYTLSQPMSKDKEMTIEVGGKTLPPSAYSVNYEKNQITFKPDSAPEAGEKFIVRYFSKVIVKK
jgi:hypothetical protein